MIDLSYEELVNAKRQIQQKKESAVRSMSSDDWAQSKANLDKAASLGQLPPKIKSRRHYREESIGF